jgi:hypothetical protein
MSTGIFTQNVKMILFNFTCQMTEDDKLEAF